MCARELFPSYLFAWVSNQWEFIRNLIGVRDFIRHSGFIYSVDPRIVDELRKREGPTGYIRIDSSFLPGQQVKLKQKEEWAGVYLGLSDKYKARVLFSLLGSDVELELYERDLVTT
jgi:transcription antitermination factor NusG